MAQCIVRAEISDGTTSFNSFSSSISGFISLMYNDIAMYSLSVVDRAIYVINLEHHMIGQLVYDIT